MTLSFYVARKFLFAFVAVLAGFAVLMLLLDLIEELHRGAGDGIGFGQALGLAALNTPATLYQIMPLVVILATLILFVGLSRTSELVVIRASGRSALHNVAPPVVTGLLIGLFGVAVLNPMVAATSQAYSRLQSHYSQGGESSIMSIGQDGLWLRQGNSKGQTVIRASHASLDGTHLVAATFITFNGKGQPLQRIEAAKASLGKGVWKLTQVKSWDLNRDNPEAAAETAPQLSLPSNLTRAQIRDSFGEPSRIPIWQLPAFIKQLDKAGFSAREQRVWLQMELALPVLLAAMVLVGAVFTMRPARFGRTGMMVLFALISGFAIFFLRNFAQVLGTNGQIPVALAAWGPPVAGVLLPLGLLLHLEDG